MRTRRHIIPFLIILFYTTANLFAIIQIPGEWFGDISNVDEYTRDILGGKWPFNFIQSPGPFYHYLIAPFVAVYGHRGYETYKAASVIVGFLGLAAFYLLAKEINGRRFALVGILIYSFTFWYMVWCRLGNSQIAIPLLSSLMGYFIIRYARNQTTIDLLLGAAVSSLGWYTYPQTFIFPPVYFLIMAPIILFKTSNRRKAIIDGLLFVLTMAMAVIPFIGIITLHPQNFQTGYIGKKVFPVLSSSPGKIISIWAGNYLDTLEMFHIQGDRTFRVNIPGRAQLDTVSGIAMILGIGYLVLHTKWKKCAFVVSMILILILPSTSPALPPAEIPNNGRTIAVLPYVILLITGGYFSIFGLIRNKCGTYPGAVILILILYLSAYLNLEAYFAEYPYGLPNHNIPFGKIIAGEIDKTPPNSTIVIDGCCWSEFGTPEPKGILAEVAEKRQIKFFAAHNNPSPFDCQTLNQSQNRITPLYFFADPRKMAEQEKILQCKPGGTERKIMFGDYYIVWSYQP